MNERFPCTATSFYKQLRELKFDITELMVGNGCKALGFDLKELYQECIQRRYENEDFVVAGFEKQAEVSDFRSFEDEFSQARSTKYK